MMRRALCAAVICSVMASTAFAGNFKKGEVIDVTVEDTSMSAGRSLDFRALVIGLNPEPIKTWFATWQPGDPCWVEDGGRVTVLGDIDDKQVLVSYDRNWYFEPLTDTDCATGVIFAAKKDWLADMRGDLDTSGRDSRYPPELRRKVRGIIDGFASNKDRK